MKKTITNELVAKLMAIFFAGFMAGCGEDAETDTALGVNPVSADVYGKGSTVVLTAFDPDAGVYDYSPYPDDYEETRAAKASQDAQTNPNTNLAAQIFLPLKWHVGSPHLGRILSSAGYTAVYESMAASDGQNVVTVNDQVGRAGVAVVNHRIPEQTNTAATASQ